MATGRAMADERNDSRSVPQDLEQRYNDLVNRNLAGIFRTTATGKFLECNDAMAHILGYADKQDLLSHEALDLYHSEDDRERFVTTLRKDRKLINFEIRLKHRSGREVIVLENVYMDDGEETTIHGMLIDITAYKQAELEQRSLMASYRSLVEQIRDGLVVVAEGTVRYANPAADLLAEKNLAGLEFMSVVVPEDRPVVAQVLRDAPGSKGLGPFHIRLLNKPDRELMLHGIGMLHNGLEAVQITLMDRGAQEAVFEDRMRFKMAEEVNQVLRMEIQEHRATQDELKRAKQFARSLINSSLDMIMAVDKDGMISEYNPAASIRFGYEATEVIGKPASILYADPVEHKRIQREMDEHGVFTGEIRNVDKDGREFTSFLAASRLFNEEGQVIGAMGVSRDVTRMKEDQEAMRASEERYRDLFENATDLIQSVDRKGSFEYVNTSWRSTLGYSEVEMAGMTIWDIVHPAHRAGCEAAFERIMRGEDTGQIRTVFVTKEGRSITVEGMSNRRMVGGEPVATRSIFRDITGVLAARQQVQEHEAKLRALFESSEHMFWTVDQHIRLTSYNVGYGDMIEKLHGTRPELRGEKDEPRKKFTNEEYHAFWEAKYKEAFAGKPLRFETDLVDKKGRRVCNEIFLSPVFGPDGQVYEVFGVGHEITEQKVAEDLVREQAARLKAIFESAANMMIWTLDRDLRLTSCNAHFLRSIEEIHGIRFAVGDQFDDRMIKRLSAEHAKELLRKYNSALKGKPQQFEVELIDLEGKPAWVENFLNPIVVGGVVQELSCLAYGITDRKEAQQEIAQSLNEKEVLLKEVHHRVKNNLQVISSIMSLQSAHVNNDTNLLQVLHHSRDRVRSMALIHESLYQNKEFSSIDLGNYIDGLARNLMMSYSLNGRVKLSMELMPVNIVLDEALPCGLILNEIISNALKHAFPGEQAGTVHVKLSLDGDKVSIAIGDDGVGVADGFDEKRDGNLGLELVQMLVDQLDGEIKRVSGRGVTYLLTFERTKNTGHGADERPRSGG